MILFLGYKNERPRGGLSRIYHIPFTIYYDAPVGLYKALGRVFQGEQCGRRLK
jgi:hypothetical protein